LAGGPSGPVRFDPGDRSPGDRRTTRRAVLIDEVFDIGTGESRFFIPATEIILLFVGSVPLTWKEEPPGLVSVEGGRVCRSLPDAASRVKSTLLKQFSSRKSLSL
jgi:hypothetical protein